MPDFVPLDGPISDLLARAAFARDQARITRDESVEAVREARSAAFESRLRRAHFANLSRAIIRER